MRLICYIGIVANYLNIFSGPTRVINAELCWIEWVGDIDHDESFKLSCNESS